MGFEGINFFIADEVKALGVVGSYLAIGSLQNKESDPSFEEMKAQVVADTISELSQERIDNDPILIGFRQLHKAVGRSIRKNVASPENLLSFLLQTGHLPHVNLLVDIYNLVSIKSRLALGAHDIAKISGNINLRLTDGTENFWPLGYDQPKPVGPGEYSYVDDDNDIICRLEVRQVEKTKVTVQTTECFYIIQGNAATSAEYVRTVSDELLSLTTRFCGGEARILYEP